MRPASVKAFGAACALSATMIVSSCSTAPEMDEVDGTATHGPTVQNIVDRIQCEVSGAVHVYSKAFKGNHWGVVATLTLQVDDSVGVNPTVSFIEPSEFSFGLGAGVTGSRQRIYTQTLTYKTDDLLAQEGPTSCERRSRLAGDLKIQEVVRTAVGGPNGVAASTAFGQTLQFVVVHNVSGVGPTWSLSHLKGPGGLLGASRTDTQKLVISFAAPEGAKGTVHALTGTRMNAADAASSAAIEAATAQNLNMILQSLHISQ